MLSNGGTVVDYEPALTIINAKHYNFVLVRN